MTTLTARWLVPVDTPPLPNGILTIDDEMIVAVEPSGRADLDLGDAVILPGLVNAHTHLDLSGMHAVAPPRLPLTDWLRQVIAHRRHQTAVTVAADIRAGLAECVRFGTTLIGDISGDGGSWGALVASPVRAVVFRELLGLPADRARAAWQAFEAWRVATPDTPTCRKGVSPHAPYSVSRWLYQQASDSGLPMATHLAESREELELLAHHTGPFVEFLRGVGVWAPDELTRSVGEVISLVREKALIVHGNYLDTMPPPGSTIVYCPRTHAAFGHAPHPVRDLLAAGVRVALGTDSLASNPDLDLLAEARFLYQRKILDGPTALHLATLAGAKALGFGDRTGSLTPGKSADLVVIPLPPRDADPIDLVLASDLPVSRVMCRGRWLFPAV